MSPSASISLGLCILVAITIVFMVVLLPPPRTSMMSGTAFEMLQNADIICRKHEARYESGGYERGFQDCSRIHMLYRQEIQKQLDLTPSPDRKVLDGLKSSMGWN